MTVKEMQTEIHNTAKEKGWWEKPRNVGEMLALVHSEVSEAFDEHCAGHLSLYYIDGKPEGAVVEIADAYIRILDIFSASDMTAHEMYEDDDRARSAVRVASTSFMVINKHVSTALESWRVKGECGDAYFTSLQLALYACCDVFGWKKLHEAIEIKMAYNKTRSYRHGGKVA